MNPGPFGERVRLRVEQFDPRPGEVDANLERIRAGQQAAADDGVHLVVTPELSLTGYDVRDRVHSLARPAREEPFPALSGTPDLILGMIEQGPDFVPRNAALHLRGGRVLHRHHKLYLPTYGMFDEGRYFGRGDSVGVYDAGAGWRPGLLICEDLWHPGLIYLLAMAGANLIIAQAAGGGRGAWEGSARGERFASAESWETIARAAAISYGVYMVVANRVGVEGSVVFAGGSLIIAPDGEILARGDDLGEDRPTADLSIDAVGRARRPGAHIRDEDPSRMLRELRRLTGEP